MAFLLWQHHCFAPREAKFWTTFYNHCPHNSFRAIYVWFPYRLKYTTFKKHSLSNSLIFIKSHAVLSRDMFWTSFKATFILKEMLQHSIKVQIGIKQTSATLYRCNKDIIAVKLKNGFTHGKLLLDERVRVLGGIAEEIQCVLNKNPVTCIQWQRALIYLLLINIKW